MARFFIIRPIVAIVIGYGTKLTQSLALGVNVRLIRDQLSPQGTAYEAGNGIATGFSFDVGVMYRPRSLEFLSLGANLSNIGPKLTYVDKDQADPLPMNLRLGTAVKLLESDYNNISWLMDFNRLLVKRDTSGHSDEFYKAIFSTWGGSSFGQQLRQFTFSTGVEYWYGAPRLLALRAGYFWEDPSAGNRRYMTFGAGIRWESFGFDFSYISTFEDQHPLGNTLRLSISIGWGGGN